MQNSIVAQEHGDRRDNSLRGKALSRALKNDVPRTLTPYEWQEFYAEHGVPDNHRPAASGEPPSRWSWISRWFRGPRGRQG